MKKMRFLTFAVVLGCCFFFITPHLCGQPASARPGSILVFPYFDARPGAITVVTVTNTNTDMTPARNGVAVGSVRVHFFYVTLISGEQTPENDDDMCSVTNVWRSLTPGETFSAFVSAHSESEKEGFLYVVATEPTVRGEPIAFNYLIGEAQVVNPFAGFLWTVPPYSFRALSRNENPDPGHYSAGGHLYTDEPANGGNNDGEVTFTGAYSGFTEYEAWPDELYLASFHEQVDGFASFLVLLSPLAYDWRTKISFLYYNDAEVEYSQTRKIRCFIKQPLEYFMPGADDLPPGPGIAGFPDRQIGWARIISLEAVNTVNSSPLMDHPPLLGMIIRTFSDNAFQYDFYAGNILPHKGLLDEQNTNWDFTFEGGVREEE